MGDTPSWARQGAENAAKQAKKEASQKGSKFTPEFYLTEADNKAIIRVINFEDVVIVKTHGIKDGKFWKQTTCPGKSKCPLCKADVYQGTRYVVNVIDRRARKSKGKTYKNEIKLWMMHSGLYEQLVGFNDKYGCDNYDIEVTRKGKGKNINYNLFPEEEVELSAEDENKKLLDIFKELAPKSISELEKFVPEEEADDFAQDSGEQNSW